MELETKTAAAVPKNFTYRGPLIPKSKTKNGLRTLPCRDCGKPYTDIIDPSVDPKRGGYIICPRCLMKDADQVNEENKEIQIDSNELLQAMQDKKLKQYRQKYNFTQSDLAKWLGFSEVQFKRIEKTIPSNSVIRKVEKRLLKIQKVKQEVV